MVEPTSLSSMSTTCDTGQPQSIFPGSTSIYGREKGVWVKARAAARRVASTHTPLTAKYRTQGTEGK